MCNCLPFLTVKDKTGYHKRCFFSCNIRKSEGIIQYCNIYDEPGLIINIDHIKAFKPIECSVITMSLKIPKSW